jgi:NAD(P)-dependent dehydrogenase (short-subunit alcohol dehydrogenase family)
MMKNKTVIVTGGNAGIGYETALGIAKLGATTYIISRDETKAKAAVEQLKAESHNLAIDYFIADFSSQKSVRQVAERIKQKLTVIDVLVNNAGGVYPSFALSEDGLEMTIATNHFGPFLLTNLLLPLIEKSSEGRIVNVSSRSHYRGKIDFESFTKEKGYFVMKAYEQSKLANGLFTSVLAERLKSKNITVNSLHPGVVKTDIGKKGTPAYIRWFWSMFTFLGGISVEDGAKTSIYLASSNEVKNVTGKHFDLCQVKEESALAKDKNLAQKLWAETERLISQSV